MIRICNPSLARLVLFAVCMALPAAAQTDPHPLSSQRFYSVETVE